MKQASSLGVSTRTCTYTKALRYRDVHLACKHTHMHKYKEIQFYIRSYIYIYIYMSTCAPHSVCKMIWFLLYSPSDRPAGPPAAQTPAHTSFEHCSGNWDRLGIGNLGRRVERGGGGERFVKIVNRKSNLKCRSSSSSKQRILQI